ncbi:MAG: hypothetical protein J6A20_03455 [Muribaculaceae bacterium]|nr:hypothetical protein [Muribaculaceae bacterium]
MKFKLPSAIVILISFVSTSILWESCSSKEESEPPITSVTPDMEIEEICKGAGIRPKNIGSIEKLLQIVDSTDYKIATGQLKDGSAWLAKFSLSGDELYSYNITSPNDNLTFLGGIDIQNHDYTSDNHLLFTITFSDGSNSSFAEFRCLFVVLDFLNGKELSFFEVESSQMNVHHSNGYKYLTPRGYLSYNSMLYCLDTTGKLSWFRNTTSQEQGSWPYCYKGFQALTSELIFMPYRVVNLKEYSVTLDLDNEKMPITGELAGQALVQYDFHKAELIGQLLNIYYGEYKLVQYVSDPVLGTTEYAKELKNEYYYSVRYPSGEILGHYKK